jgi:hypothetical protein
MLPQPIDYTFDIDGQHYRLVDWDRGGERRIRADYALAISAVPTVLETIDGASLYAEAVARECLREAPDVFWDPVPVTEARSNGTPRRVVNVDRVPRALWQAFREEVDRFLGQLFPSVQPAVAPVPPEREADPAPVAPLETVPAVFRGRAE